MPSSLLDELNMYAYEYENESMTYTWMDMDGVAEYLREFMRVLKLIDYILIDRNEIENKCA